MKRFNKVLDYLPHIIFGLISSFTVAIFYLFGSSLNSSAFESKLISLTYFTNGGGFVHSEITSQKEHNLDFKVSNGVVYNYYPRKNLIKSYSKMNVSSIINFQNKLFAATLCASPVYNDKDVTEYLHLPLYLENSSIRKGPQYDADFAAYISSRTADNMLEEFHLHSYDELLAIEKPFTLRVKNNSYSMSIRNIYLNNDTTHWNKDISSYEDRYFEYFASWNVDSVFAYADSVFDKTARTSLCFDMKPNYSHYSGIIKECLTKSQADLKLTVSNENETKEFNFAYSDLSNKYTSRFSIVCYISFAIVAGVLVALLITFKQIRKDLFKITIVVGILYAIIAIILQIIIGFNPFNQGLVTAFNAISNSMTLIFFLILITLSVLFYESKSKGTKDKNAIK